MSEKKKKGLKIAIPIGIVLCIGIAVAAILITLHVKEEALPKYRVSYVLRIDDYVTNADKFADTEVSEGRKLKKPSAPKSDVAEFTGWYICTDDEMTKYDFSKAVKTDIVLYAAWDFSEEDYDGDGLVDYEEISLGYSANMADSDGDGTSDGESDWDQDGLTNIQEISYGTDLDCVDTDLDGLIDPDEIAAGTDHLQEDTDGDGASDGWEMEHYYDPLVFDDSFNAVESYGSLENGFPICVTAEIDGLSAEAAQTLSIEKVDSSDNYLLNPSVAGYMGDGFDFSIDGEFDTAILTFTYDEDTFGWVDEDFYPAVYYLNEETGSFEYVQEQYLYDNTVTAYTSHFSTYVLLNQIDVINLMSDYSVIVPEEYRDESEDDTADYTEGTLDVMFVYDYSASMNDNDPTRISLSIIKTVCAGLDTTRAKAGITCFVKTADLRCGLTSNITELNSTVDGISFDDGYHGNSGTCGAAGVDSGLQTLKEDNADHKIMIFMTDGMDNKSYDKSYEELANEAKEAGVVVYCVGLGYNFNSESMDTLAEITGGSVYAADVASDLYGVFNGIAEDMTDIDKDSNGDGISDYYSKMIFNGEITPLNGSYEFMLHDFNYKDGESNADYDGDGILNGDEIKIIVSSCPIYSDEEGVGSMKVFIEVLSNPLIADSDGDGIDDGEDSEPLYYNFDADDYQYLKVYSNSYGYDAVSPQRFATTLSDMSNVLFNHNLSYTDGFEKSLLGYMKDHVSENDLVDEETKEALETLQKVRAIIMMTYHARHAAENGAEDEYDSSIEELENLTDQIDNLLGNEKLFDNVEKVMGIVKDAYTLVKGLGDAAGELKLSKIMSDVVDDGFHEFGCTMALDTIDYTADAFEEYLTIKAYFNTLESQTEMIREFSQYDNKYYNVDYSDLGKAASNILLQMKAVEEENVWPVVKHYLTDFDMSILADAFLDLAGKTEIGAVIEAIFDISDIVFGFGDDAEEMIAVLTYNKIAEYYSDKVTDFIKSGDYKSSDGKTVLMEHVDEAALREDITQEIQAYICTDIQAAYYNTDLITWSFSQGKVHEEYRTLAKEHYAIGRTMAAERGLDLCAKTLSEISEFESAKATLY